MRLAVAGLAALLALAPAGPARAQAACPFPGQTPMLLVRLYFGQTIGYPGAGSGPGSVSGSGVVSRRAWQRFVAERVTPALPNGFTVLDATGQFRDRAQGVIAREATEVVEVAAPDSDAFRAAIADIAAAYKRQFRQGVVGIVSQPVCGLF